MLSANDTIKAYVHYSIIAMVLSNTKDDTHSASAFAYNRVAAYRHVLQLPWSIQCKGLTIEALDLYCNNAAEFYCKLYCVNYELHQ